MQNPAVEALRPKGARKKRPNHILRMQPSRIPVVGMTTRLAFLRSLIVRIRCLPYPFPVHASSPSPARAFRLAACLSALRARAALFFCLLASISSSRARSRAFSALARWIYDHVRYTTSIDENVWCSKTYVLDQRSLVLECVTLAGVVQLVVQVLVDLAAGTVLD